MKLQRSTDQPPVVKPTTLIVLAAFERDDEGELRPALEAQQMPSEHAAVARAKLMSRSYAGVIAWKRPARPDEGEFGEPEVLFSVGDVPDME
ncbi:MAG: hypothetical protein KIT02_03150 [Devosia sp.]|uniref:hypothetical protein n=1 Tax=Devosia sp. TaxID=1871048 RepID=UPI0024C60BC9|nr:hypothetical protein [Devosia sp.]UYO00238.1 MAG: hypothetical protein KIT02_03150 [Devosia sp.]